MLNVFCPRRRLKSTSEYIYEALFLNGEGSDITVNALGYLWRLHKIYLCQVSQHMCKKCTPDFISLF
jgi:hypothetical protein